MNNKMGFTLIELLAVIVILGVLAFITTIIIMDVIEKSRRQALERTYEMIEKGAEYYVVNEYDGMIANGEELRIPIPELYSFVAKLTPDMDSESVIVKKRDDMIYYYYTGRDEKPYDNKELLKSEIENETSHMAYNILINGKNVNKVVGTKDEKDSMKNHVWYSGYLWKVIETGEGYVKLVTANSVTAISYGTNNDWKSSWVRKWLNNVSADVINYPLQKDREGSALFLNSLSRQDLLLDGTYCLDSPSNVTEETLELEYRTFSRLQNFTPISTCQNEVQERIGILSLEDYAYAYDGTLNEFSHNAPDFVNGSQNKKGGLMGYNFLDEDDMSWLMTPSLQSDKTYIVERYNPGMISKESGDVSGNGLGVRPVIYLKDTVKIDAGTGTKDNPYVLTSQLSISPGFHLSFASSGEYLYLNEGNNPYESNPQIKEKVRYRVIGIDSNGSVKIQRDDVLRNLPNGIGGISQYNGISTPFYSYKEDAVDPQTLCYADDSNWVNVGCSGKNIFSITGNGNYELYKGSDIGYFLNNQSNGFYNWFTSEYQQYIQLKNYKRVVGAIGMDYFETRSASFNDSITYPNQLYDGEIEANIVLPSWGDILSGNDININYWYMNRAKNSVIHMSFVDHGGFSTMYDIIFPWVAIRPVMHLNPNVIVESGNGTMQSPYQIKM